MTPGSSDTLMTFLGSCLLTVLLFLGRYVLDQRVPSHTRPPAEIAQRDRGPAPQAPPTTSADDRRAPSSPSGNTTSGSSTSAGQPTTTVSVSTVDTTDVTSPDTFKVIGVIDGDTADILVNRQPLRLRFNGIDTPEKGQPFGNAAKEALSNLIGGKHIRYVVRDSDRYGRSIADLYVDGLYVNKWMVEQGLAWHYVAYSNDAELAAAEQSARNDKRGLWSDPRHVAPWNWRKLSKVERDAYR